MRTPKKTTIRLSKASLRDYKKSELTCTVQYHIQAQIYPHFTVVPETVERKYAQMYSRLGNILTYIRSVSQRAKNRLIHHNPLLTEPYIVRLLSDLPKVKNSEVLLLELCLLSAGTNECQYLTQAERDDYQQDVLFAQTILCENGYYNEEDRKTFAKDLIILTPEVQGTPEEQKEALARQHRHEAMLKEKFLQYQKDRQRLREMDEIQSAIDEELFLDDDIENDFEDMEEDEFTAKLSPHHRDRIRQKIDGLRIVTRADIEYEKPLSDYERAHPDQPCTEESLCGKCLINLNPDGFAETDKEVIYITACNEQSITGVSLNKLMFRPDTYPLKNNPDMIIPEPFDSIRLGGPHDEGFCHIFFPDEVYSCKDPRQLHQHGITITSSRIVMFSHFQKKGPNPCLLALGNYIWTPKQFAYLLSSNNWALIPADKDLLFATTAETCWEEARKRVISTKIGIADKLSYA